MSFEQKKNILSVLSFLNTICCCCYLGVDIITGSLNLILFDFVVIILAFLPFLYIRNAKIMKHMFFLTLPFALSGVLCYGITNFLFSAVGLIVSFISSNEEKGMLEKLLKKYPIMFVIIIILSGMTFLASSSVLDYFAELTYGFDMLGEICATIFLFFMIVACKKEYLIFKNRGSIRESIIVSLPFIIYIFYIGSALLATNIVEGYDFVSLDNIVAVSIFYIFVGIFEDFLIRGLSLNILLEKYGHTKKGIWLSIFLSSLFFGMIHFSNLLTGASLQGVIIQVIAATCIGFYFSAIYLRSGNVWTPALLHGFYDLAVSVSAFFVINEVVDTTADYAASISNYSWANLLIGVFYIALALFLLRKNKMKNVMVMLSDKKIENKRKDGALKFLFIGFGLGCCVLICYISFMSMFQIDRLARDTYNKIITTTDYQKEYNLTYINDYVNYNSLSDEVKILFAISNLEDEDFVDSYSISKAEEDVLDEPIFTYIDKDKIKTSLNDIFESADIVNYVSVNISYKTTCDYESDLSKYVCVTTNNSQTNNFRVYSNISSIEFGDGNNIEVYVYYLVEDLDSNTLYADSNLNTVYRYNTLVKNLNNGIEFDTDSNSNREFWKAIEENNDGMIPTYKLTFKLSVTGEAMYFVSSEFLTNSIEIDNSVKEEVLRDKVYLYNSSNYSFTYNKAYFDIYEEKNKLIVKNDDRICLEMNVISSDNWLTKYKNSNFTNVTLGNYNYYNFGNEYLIYKDNFYVITINTVSEVERLELLKIITSLEFK